jgi:hypothetical protein
MFNLTTFSDNYITQNNVSGSKTLEHLNIKRNKRKQGKWYNEMWRNSKIFSSAGVQIMQARQRDML